MHKKAGTSVSFILRRITFRRNEIISRQNNKGGKGLLIMNIVSAYAAAGLTPSVWQMA